MKKLILFAGLLAAVSAAPTATAAELGLTPSHVYGLWTNVNAALEGLAESYDAEAAWTDELKGSAPSRFSGKRPGDVLKRVSEFRRGLARLERLAGQESREITAQTNAKITPSDVFLNSGKVLGDVVLLLISRTDEQTLVTGYFESHQFNGKTPSDVFGLVDLANRRLELILTRVKG